MNYPPPSGHPGSGQPWPPQGPWQPEGQWHAPPPKGGTGWKWVLGAVALLAIVGVTVVVTVAVIGEDEESGAPSASSPRTSSEPTSDVASANDTGPVAIITEEPTCAPVRPILIVFSDAQQNGWDRRDASIPASGWTHEVRVQYEEVGDAMRETADRLVPMVKLTPHRVVRELYEQMIAYLRAYAQAIPRYRPADDFLARSANAAGDAISNICDSIRNGSAAARASLVQPMAAPELIASVGDVENPQRFLTEIDPVCAEWADAVSEFQRDAAAWGTTSPDVPASQWSSEQRALNDEVVPVMERFAERLVALGQRSTNPTLRDIADLSAIYRFAYVKAIPTYMPADSHLTAASIFLSGVVNAGCKALMN